MSFISLQTDTGAELQVCDVDKMVTVDTKPVSMILEGSHVGRGSEWYVSLSFTRIQ